MTWRTDIYHLLFDTFQMKKSYHNYHLYPSEGTHYIPNIPSQTPKKRRASYAIRGLEKKINKIRDVGKSEAEKP